MIKQNTIGILGGGQLARMSLHAASRMGIPVAVMEKEKDSPAGMLTPKEHVGWVDDRELLKKFAESVSVVTLENEFIDSGHLEFIESLGVEMIPSSYTISLIQDKYIQKRTLASNGIPVPGFIPVTDMTAYPALSKLFGKKFILKSRKMGYDGYGNALVRDERGYREALSKLLNRHSEIYAESFVDFEKELAVMVVRTKRETKVYPVVETVQENHICKLVLAPAQIPVRARKLAEQIAVEAVAAVEGYGIFGIEMFYLKDGSILVNEMAPRPHNSGHYTIESTITSQFENHIRAVLNLPLGNTEMNCRNAVMINILGRVEGTGEIKNYDQVLKKGNFHLHMYGKKLSRRGRKMGHITVKGNDMNELVNKAKKIERSIII